MEAGLESSRRSIDPLTCSAPSRPEKRTRGSAVGPSTPLNVLSAGLGRSGYRNGSNAANRFALGKGPSLRAQVLKLLDDHKSSRAAMVVHLLFWCIIIMSVIIISLMSSPRLANEENERDTLFLIDLAIDGLFIFELLLRIWATGWTGGMDPFMYIDLLAITPFMITLVQLGIEGRGEAQKSRLNVLKLVRLLKLARHYEGARVLWGALKLSFEELLVPLYFLLCMILLFAALLYMVEVGETRAARPRARAHVRTHTCTHLRARASTHACIGGGKLESAPIPLINDTQAEGDAKADFDSITNSAWFVLVTLSTVGYGDTTPATDAGHVIASVAIVAGVLFMSMPLAIVGNNFVTVCS